MTSKYSAKHHMHKAKHTIINLIKEGITPKKLALSITCGIVVGLFPVIGATTILSLSIALIFRLNLIAVQLVNWLITPIHLLCLIPFLKFGEWIVGADSSALNLQLLQAKFNNGFWQGMLLVLNAQMLAVLAWLLCALPLCFLLYVPLHHFFKKVK